MKQSTKKSYQSHSAVDVRQFIQDNYTPYTGDDRFLAGPTERTSHLWELCLALKKAEIANGGVLDLDTSVPTSITSHQAGYINPEEAELETIVGLQTDKLGKRALHVNGGIRMAKTICQAYGYELDPEIEYIFSAYRKTHNQGVFDVYTPEMN